MKPRLACLGAHIRCAPRIGSSLKCQDFPKQGFEFTLRVDMRNCFLGWQALNMRISGSSQVYLMICVCNVHMLMKTAWSLAEFMVESRSLRHARVVPTNHIGFCITIPMVIPNPSPTTRHGVAKSQKFLRWSPWARHRKYSPTNLDECLCHFLEKEISIKVARKKRMFVIVVFLQKVVVHKLFELSSLSQVWCSWISTPRNLT